MAETKFNTPNPMKKEPLTYEEVKDNATSEMPEEELPKPTKGNPWDTMVPLRAAISIAMYNAVFLLSRYNRTITAKQAHAKYGGLVDYWVRCGYIVPIPTRNGRLVRYSEPVLAELYRQHTKGII